MTYIRSIVLSRVTKSEKTVRELTLTKLFIFQALTAQRTDFTRYDRTRPCLAYKQFARGFKVWADTFNFMCAETGETDSRERIVKVETRVIAIVARLLARLDCTKEES